MVIKSSSFLNAMSNPEQQAAQPNLPSVTATAFCKDLMLPLTRCGSTTLTCAREARPNNSSILHRLTGADELAFVLKEQRVASCRAGGMPHASRELRQAPLQPVEIIRHVGGHRQADSATLQTNLRSCGHTHLLRLADADDP
jgi:hypothetical protein